MLNNPLFPKLADKQVIEAELNVDGSKHVSGAPNGNFRGKISLRKTI